MDSAWKNVRITWPEPFSFTYSINVGLPILPGTYPTAPRFRLGYNHHSFGDEDFKVTGPLQLGYPASRVWRPRRLNGWLYRACISRRPVIDHDPSLYRERSHSKQIQEFKFRGSCHNTSYTATERWIQVIRSDANATVCEFLWPEAVWRTTLTPDATQTIHGSKEQ